jgi:hypothetical protein
MTSGVAEYLAAQVRRCLPVARTLPVDVSTLARQLGIDEIICVPNLIEDGRLEQRDGHVRVLLSSRANPHRQRYTLAHEIAHLLLADPRREVIARRMKADDEVERFCDNFAAALLLPRALILADYRQGPHTLATVRHLAARTDTSLAAAAVRLNEVGGWPHALLHWKRGDRGWRYRWGAGVPTALHRRLRSALETSGLLDELRDRGSRDQTADIPMRVGRSGISVPGDISIRGHSAIALVTFPAVGPGSDRR